MNKNKILAIISFVFLWANAALAEELKVCVNIKTGAWKPSSMNKSCNSKTETTLILNTSGQVGPKGEKGDAGVTGVQGIKGDTGQVGPRGGKGDSGAIGPQGVQGIQGVKGDIGPQGLPGADGQSGGLGLYDSNGQFIGNLVDTSARVDGGDEGGLAVYSPSLNSVLMIPRNFRQSMQLIGVIELNENGTARPMTYQDARYLNSNCTGSIYYTLNQRDLLAFPVIMNGYVITTNNDQYWNGRYYSVSMGGLRAVQLQHTYFNVNGQCYPDEGSAFITVTNDLTPIIQEVTLPFNLPISYPLRFTP